MRYLLSLLLYSSVLAQNTTVPNAFKFIDLPEFGVVNSIVVDDARRSIYAIGQSKNSQAILSKLDFRGLVQWTLRVGAGANETFVSVEIDEATGFIYAAGNTGNQPFDNHAITGASDNLVCKFCASGRKEWCLVWGSSGEDVLSRHTYDKYRNRVLAVSNDDGIPTLAFISDAGELIKKESSIAASMYTMDVFESEYLDVAAGNGSIYITGKVVISRDDYGIFEHPLLIVTDADGVLSWSLQVDFSASARTKSIVLDEENDLIVLSGDMLTQPQEWPSFTATIGGSAIVGIRLSEQGIEFSFRSDQERYYYISGIVKYDNKYFVSQTFGRTPHNALLSYMDPLERTRNTMLLAQPGWNHSVALDIATSRTDMTLLLCGSYARQGGRLNNGFIGISRANNNDPKAIQMFQEFGVPLPSTTTSEYVEYYYVTEEGGTPVKRGRNGTRARSTPAPSGGSVSEIVGGLSTGALIGIIVGNIFFMIFVFLGCAFCYGYFMYKKNKAKQANKLGLSVSVQNGMEPSDTGLMPGITADKNLSSETDFSRV